MDLRCEEIGKRFGYQWVIRHCNWSFPAGSMTGIKGNNGSGKSTFMKLIAGQLTPSQGSLHYSLKGNPIKNLETFKHISFVAPYTDLVQEFSLQEMYKYHFTFKDKIFAFDFIEFKNILGLGNLRFKRIADFSSGMNQRLQLSLALLSKTELLLLDEPTSFLDESVKTWFNELLNKYGGNKTVIIASNDEYDFQLCSRTYDIATLKTVS